MQLQSIDWSKLMAHCLCEYEGKVRRLTVKAPAKNASENVVYCIYLLTSLVNKSIDAKSVDSNQTVPSKTSQQMTKADNFCCDWHFKGYILTFKTRWASTRENLSSGVCE